MIYLSSMMKIKKIIIPVISIGLLVSCEYSNDQFKMKKGDVIYLQEFPDSSYVANLDSILKDENVLDTKPKEQKQFTMTLADLKMVAVKSPKSGSPNPKSIRKSSGVGALSKEEFAKVFLASMDIAKKDKSKLFEVQVGSEGETIESVLKKAYKTSAVSGVPKVMLKYGLSSLNPDLDLESLRLGQKIKLPKLK
jgi:hypothetical protein